MPKLRHATKRPAALQDVARDALRVMHPEMGGRRGRTPDTDTWCVQPALSAGTHTTGSELSDRLAVEVAMWCAARGWSMGQLADAAGLARSTITGWMDAYVHPELPGQRDRLGPSLRTLERVRATMRDQEAMERVCSIDTIQRRPIPVHIIDAWFTAHSSKSLAHRAVTGKQRTPSRQIMDRHRARMDFVSEKSEERRRKKAGEEP